MIYPAKINRRFFDLRFAGELPNANAVGANASFVCGAAVEIYLQIENETVIAARFKAAGCGFLLAAADVYCEKIIGRNVAKIDFAVLAQTVESEFEAVEQARRHCFEMCAIALKAAIKNFRQSARDEWNGDEALICVCFGVSEKTIDAVIDEFSLTTVDEVSARCSAGAGCGSCLPLIQELLDNKILEID